MLSSAVPDDWCAPLGSEMVPNKDNECPSVRLRNLYIPLWHVPIVKQEVSSGKYIVVCMLYVARWGVRGSVLHLQHCAVQILCAQPMTYYRASEVQMSVVKFIALTSVNCTLLATMRLSLSIGIYSNTANKYHGVGSSISIFSSLRSILSQMKDLLRQCTQHGQTKTLRRGQAWPSSQRLRVTSSFFTGAEDLKL